MNSDIEKYEPIEIDIDDGRDDDGSTICRKVYVCGNCGGHLEWNDLLAGTCHHCGKGLVSWKRMPARIGG